MEVWLGLVGHEDARGCRVEALAAVEPVGLPHLLRLLPVRCVAVASALLSLVALGWLEGPEATQVVWGRHVQRRAVVRPAAQVVHPPGWRRIAVGAAVLVVYLLVAVVGSVGLVVSVSPVKAGRTLVVHPQGEGCVAVRARSYVIVWGMGVVVGSAYRVGTPAWL